MKRYVLPVLCLLALSGSGATAGDGIMVGPVVGPRFNSLAGDAAKDATNLTSPMGFMFGVDLWIPLGSTLRGQVQLGYAQRGFGMESSILGMTSTSTTTFNYVDVGLGVNWLFLGGDQDAAFQPYLGVMLVPGMFLSGTTKSSYGGSEQTMDVESSNVNTLHVAVRPQIGADFRIMSGMCVGVAVGYELGLTDTAKEDNTNEGEHQSVMWNGITTGVRVLFEL